VEQSHWQTVIRWIVLHPERRMVLVSQREGRLVLPTSTSTGDIWLGDCPALLEAAAGIGLDAIVLGCRELDDDHDNQLRRLTMAVTLRDRAVTVPPDTRWVPREDAAALLPPGIEEVRAGRPPWEDPRWFDDAERWLRSRLEDVGRPVTGPVAQHRSWELSSVVRAPTAAGTVWLKTSFGSRLFAQEGAVLAALSEWFPAHTPAPLARCDEQRLMLLDDLGPPLGRDAPLETQEPVLVDFARLQASTADRLDALRSLGLVDRGPLALGQELGVWFPDLEATAQLPGLDSESWLTDTETAALRAALPRILEHCNRMAGGPVPLTLVHGDLHLGNVAAGSGRPMLFDWTDACLGHPFFDLITALPKDEARRTRLRDAYLSAWTDHASPSRLTELWQSVEILGPLHHAISYREIAAGCSPPIDSDMASATVDWLRSALAALEREA